MYLYNERKTIVISIKLIFYIIIYKYIRDIMYFERFFCIL